MTLEQIAARLAGILADGGCSDDEFIQRLERLQLDIEIAARRLREQNQ